MRVSELDTFLHNCRTPKNGSGSLQTPKGPGLHAFLSRHCDHEASGWACQWLTLMIATSHLLQNFSCSSSNWQPMSKVSWGILLSLMRRDNAVLMAAEYWSHLGNLGTTVYIIHYINISIILAAARIVPLDFNLPVNQTCLWYGLHDVHVHMTYCSGSK